MAAPAPVTVGDSGIPYPTMAPIFNMGSLQSQLNAIPVNMQGANAYAAQALRTGPSAWANLANIQNAEQLETQKEQAEAQGAGQTASVENQIASSGGLSSGARERAAESGANSVLDMQQGLQKQGNENSLQIGINDEQNRISQLGALPGIENEAIQPLFQKADILTNAQAQQNQAANTWNMNLYNTQMGAWGAQQSANAIADSGKKG